MPVVYEAGADPLFPQQESRAALTITIQAGDAAPAAATLDPDLPRAPDAGFFGRDETLLALDRAFDTQRVVLLHAFAGSGKTATAAEFARWYALTGGIAGPVLFTSFEQYRPLPRRAGPDRRGVRPAARTSGRPLAGARRCAARRAVALQVLEQVPVLWIWDNVEPIAGFPRGHASAWSAANSGSWPTSSATPDDEGEVPAHLPPRRARTGWATCPAGSRSRRCRCRSGSSWPGPWPRSTGGGSTTSTTGGRCCGSPRATR